MARAGTAIALDRQELAVTSAATAVTVAGGSRAVAATPPAGLAQSHGNFVWSHNGDKIEVDYKGTLEFTDDDTDIKTLSPYGSLKIKDGGWLGGRTVEFKADGSGQITRRYWVGMSEKPFEPEGRLWLAQALPRFIRQTGLGAPARVARILKAKGPNGVLAEISLIEGGWGKRIYFTELFNAGHLDPATLRQALAQAGREIDSKHELATLLIKSGESLASTSRRGRRSSRRRGASVRRELRALVVVVASPLSQRCCWRSSTQPLDRLRLRRGVAPHRGQGATIDKTTRPAFFGVSRSAATTSTAAC